MVFCFKFYRVVLFSGVGLISFWYVYVLFVDIVLLEMILYCLFIICFVKFVMKFDILMLFLIILNFWLLLFLMFVGMIRIEDYESMEYFGVLCYLLIFVSVVGERYCEFLLVY